MTNVSIAGERLLSRRTFIGGLGVAAASLALGGCSSTTTNIATSDGTTPEISTINWGRANSGNIFVTLAQQKGYFEEYGLTANENPVQNDADAMAALSSGKVDVTSNQGTVGPLQQIAKGVDLTIVGGYMLQGMYMVAKKGTTWNGVEDLVGKSIAHASPQLPVCYAMLNAGYDPMTDINWVQTSTAADRLAAVIAGEADYGYLSGDMLYSVSQNPDVDIVVYADELEPTYGCCRMNLRTDFVKSNPTTVKLMLKAVIRAEAYFQANKDESANILAEQLNTTPEYCAAYLKNDHYVITNDPVRNRTVTNWDIMKQVGMVDEDADSINIDDHIDTSFYEAALNEVAEEHGDEYPDWWKDRKAFFNEYNA